MTKDFLKENQRKTKLFNKWIELLSEYHSSTGNIEYDEVYEGLAQFNKHIRRTVDLKLEDGGIVKDLNIGADLGNSICLTDQMFVVLGRKRRKWSFLDIISIGSIVSEDAGGIHITFNPIYLNDGLKESRHH